MRNKAIDDFLCLLENPMEGKVVVFGVECSRGYYYSQCAIEYMEN